MRYAILSDIHSNWEALQSVLHALRAESIDQILCLGDTVGYGANPNECVEWVHDHCAAVVLGNHDIASACLLGLEYFNSAAHDAVLWNGQMLTEKHKKFLRSLPLTHEESDFVLVHASLHEPAKWHYVIDLESARQSLSQLKKPLCFHGHSHKPAVFVQQKNGDVRSYHKPVVIVEPSQQYLINVGSVGQPRDGSPTASFAIYDTEAKTVEIQRVRYDIAIAQSKILQAGLPPFLAQRLAYGK